MAEQSTQPVSNQSGSPYRDLFVQDPAAKINPDININIESPKVKDAFRRSALGEDVVTQELIDTLTDGRRTLSRSFTKHGGMYDPSDDENTSGVITISDLGKDEKFMAWTYKGDDLPSRIPPGTVEQVEFLQALHESEHAMSAKRPLLPNLPESMEKQIHEIDADAAVMKFLDDSGEDGLKQYWLQWRHVQSFQRRSLEGSAHDTATFLRVYESTGEEIDLVQLFSEKHDLMQKIAQKTNSYTAKTGDIMGALADILKEDAAGTDPQKKLSPVQRAEAQSFLRDAAAIGYEANPDYPPPARKPELEAPALNAPAA